MLGKNDNLDRKKIQNDRLINQRVGASRNTLNALRAEAYGFNIHFKY